MSTISANLKVNSTDEASALVHALEVQQDIINDTVLDELFLTPNELRDLAAQSDEHITARLKDIRDAVSASIDQLRAVDALLYSAKAALKEHLNR